MDIWFFETKLSQENTAKNRTNYNREPSVCYRRLFFIVMLCPEIVFAWQFLLWINSFYISSQGEKRTAFRNSPIVPAIKFSLVFLLVTIALECTSSMNLA